MTRELILVGASVRAAAFSAIRAGFRPYAIDQYGDRDLRAVCTAVRIKHYPRDLARALRDAPAAPWMYAGGLENHPRLVNAMAAIRPLWGNAAGVLRRARDPFELSAILRSAGFRFPEIWRERASIAGAEPQPPVLRKPFRSCGGLRIGTVSGPQPATRGFYYEACLDGEPWSAVFVAAGSSCRLLGASRPLTRGSPHFIYCGSIAVPMAQCPDQGTLIRLGAFLASELELRGLFNLDLIWHGGQWWLLEINPRYSASIEVLERAAGFRAVAIHASACESPTQPLPSATLDATRVVGKAIVYADNDSVVPPQFPWLVEQWNRDPLWPDIADLPPVGEAIRQGSPVCTVFAEGLSHEEVERLLKHRVNCVRHVLLGGQPH